jgi:hypothetical protein
MSHLIVRRPARSEYAEYYSGYVGRVPEEDLLPALERQLEQTLTLLRGIPDSKTLFRYAPGKWSIKQLIGHIADSERVFSFRAFWFGRNATAPMPGFDQEAFMGMVDFEGRPWPELIAEVEHLRRATISLFSGFDEAAWSRRGIANESEVSVRALGYILLGHERHHIDVLKSRYLTAS